MYFFILTSLLDWTQICFLCLRKKSHWKKSQYE